MKRKLMISLAGMFLLLCGANAQISITNPFSSVSADPYVRGTNPAVPSEWKQDSTWSWSWNNITLTWQKVRRDIKIHNNSGKLVSQVALLWDYNLSEWVNYEKYYNEYHPDHTTPKYMFRMIWDPAYQAFAETWHAFYTSDGDITESESKSYDVTTSSYTGGNQSIYTYSPGTEEMIRKNLDAATMNWKNYSRSTSVLNAQEKPVSILMELWIEASQSWMNVESYTMTYTVQGEQLEMLFSQWDPGTSTWKTTGKMNWEYNSSGWLVGQYIYSWDDVNLNWENGVKIIHHYDENGYKTQSESFDWDDATQSWDYDRKEVYSYHPNGMPHKTYTYAWVEALWQYMEYEYTCRDENGNETETYHKDINYQTNEYYQGNRTVSTYSDGLLTEVLSQSLEIPGNTWVPSYRETNTWDGNRNLTLELHETYDNVNLTWKNSSKYEHFYSSYIGMDEQRELTDLCYFRNPLCPGDPIQCPGLSPDEIYQFRLITMQGKPVLDQTFSGGGTIMLPDNLPAGSYLLTIKGSKGISGSGKIIVLHK